ncbi:hypothetical protein ACFFLM_21230 [Deinococcus oregonensis]|uniref:DUF3618 domain-containing protein n=1 Tax=Deinococcus oregonensis TaxID=1805970 RepID=A0ABV6B3Z6_9DEIO
MNDQAMPEIDLLPPASDTPDEAPELSVTSAPQIVIEKVLTQDDKDSINGHIDNLIGSVAAAGADMLPPELRDEYERSFTTSRMVRAGVVATGIGPALHELMPSDGTQAAGPIRQLHPALRIALGLGVLAIASLMQRKAILGTYEKARLSGGVSGLPGGGHSVSIDAPYGGSN